MFSTGIKPSFSNAASNRGACASTVSRTDAAGPRVCTWSSMWWTISSNLRHELSVRSRGYCGSLGLLLDFWRHNLCKSLVDNVGNPRTRSALPKSSTKCAKLVTETFMNARFLSRKFEAETLMCINQLHGIWISEILYSITTSTSCSSRHFRIGSEDTNSIRRLSNEHFRFSRSRCRSAAILVASKWFNGGERRVTIEITSGREGSSCLRVRRWGVKWFADNNSADWAKLRLVFHYPQHYQVLWYLSLDLICWISISILWIRDSKSAWLGSEVFSDDLADFSSRACLCAGGLAPSHLSARPLSQHSMQGGSRGFEGSWGWHYLSYFVFFLM